MGYLIEILSKSKFENYLKENIFNKLQMQNSYGSYGSIPKDKLKYFIQPYNTTDFSYLWGQYSNTEPAGSLIATVQDLSNFSIIF
jgi:CubicO group peptidase (beta-lactamase class C family)